MKKTNGSSKNATLPIPRSVVRLLLAAGVSASLSACMIPPVIPLVPPVAPVRLVPAAPLVPAPVPFAPVAPVGSATSVPRDESVPAISYANADQVDCSQCLQA